MFEFSLLNTGLTAVSVYNWVHIAVRFKTEYLQVVWNAHKPVEGGKLWNRIGLLPYAHVVENKTQ